MDYSASNITILKGLEPVRRRPAMYIGSTDMRGLHHLVWEIVDNAVDEAINGYASYIEVIVHEDGQSVTVSDNGRGIPVDLHPVEKRSALEVILTTLHAGGKFEQGNYLRSGGLHGVGSSVVNALSEELIATIKRGGQKYQQTYERGVPLADLAPVGSATGSGTQIFFRPDSEIFDDVQFDPETIRTRLEMKTYLSPGLRVVFKDAKQKSRIEYKHEGGIGDLLTKQVEEQANGIIHADVVRITNEPEKDEPQPETQVDIALQWTDSTDEHLISFANGIPTVDGGTHTAGFRDGLAAAVLAYLEAHDAVPRGVEIKRSDIREGVVGVINVFLPEPQFQGQTKEKLNNPEIRTLVASMIRTEVESYMHKNQTTGNAIAMRVIQAARARAASRSAAKEVRRKKAVSHRLNLPGKLADCSSTDPSNSELFIVEGDSAGGSAKQGRDRRNQAILPLRGKVLNVEQATAAKVSNNKELADVVSALGCGMGDGLRLDKLRYGRVILLMDADSDGHHITTLLLTFIYRYLRPLILEGKIYLAQPPLYRVDFGKETHWALTDGERDRLIAKAKKRYPKSSPLIQRFKGLGEMMPKTLYDTTLNPKKRRLLKVTIPPEQQLETEKTFSGLMGKDASVRFRFIMENAANADDLDV